jgi:hypothetical protein
MTVFLLVLGALLGCTVLCGVGLACAFHDARQADRFDVHADEAMEIVNGDTWSAVDDLRVRRLLRGQR